MEDEGIAELLTTPESIRTLQRKLYRKAKREPACRFHALYDKIYRADILSHAYNLVRANKGSAGIDGVTFKDIDAEGEAVAFKAELAKSLRSKTYKPSPVKRSQERLCTYTEARPLSALRAFQGTGDSGLAEGACPVVKNIGKPYRYVKAVLMLSWLFNRLFYKQIKVFGHHITKVFSGYSDFRNAINSGLLDQLSIVSEADAGTSHLASALAFISRSISA